MDIPTHMVPFLSYKLTVDQYIRKIIKDQSQIITAVLVGCTAYSDNSSPDLLALSRLNFKRVLCIDAIESNLKFCKHYFPSSECHVIAKQSVLSRIDGLGLELKYFENSPVDCSSIFDMHSRKVESSSHVKTRSLDSIVSEFGIPYDDISFIGIDLEGSEYQALMGASKCLFGARAVVVEVSTYPVFVNTPLLSDIDLLMRQNCYVRVSCEPTFGHGDVVYANTRYVQYNDK